LTTRPVPESLSPAIAERPGRAPAPSATELATQVAAFLGEKQAEDLLILDVSGPFAIVDYFVVATVRNTRQAQAIARELDLEVKHLRGRRKRNQGGLESEDSNWVLLDFDDVVVHLFLPEARAYYSLDTLWADAPRLPVPPPRVAPAGDRGSSRHERRVARQFQVFPSDDAPK
jgi:ribosome-associated protein